MSTATVARQSTDWQWCDVNECPGTSAAQPACCCGLMNASLPLNSKARSADPDLRVPGSSLGKTADLADGVLPRLLPDASVVTQFEFCGRRFGVRRANMAGPDFFNLNRRMR